MATSSLDLSDWLSIYKATASRRRAAREQAELEAAERRRREQASRPLPRYQYRARRPADPPRAQYKSRLARLAAIGSGEPDPWG